MPGRSLIGLTGGIAAGKSEALRILGELGAETLSTDAVVHELLDGDEVRGELVERWGPEVVEGGRVDRSKLAGIVFEDPEELAWLVALLHPLVGRHVAAWREEMQTGGGGGIAVVEVPLLFEGSMAEIFDATVAVVADDELRRRRAETRGTDALEGRSARQLSQDEKAARATFVITNHGSLEQLEADLRALLGDLRAAAADP